MATDAQSLALAPAARTRRDGKMTFAGGLVTLAEAILVALAVPFMVVALPLVMLALLVLKVVRARSRSR